MEGHGCLERLQGKGTDFMDRAAIERSTLTRVPSETETETEP